MKLIDADKLKEQMEERMWHGASLQHALMLVDDAPTVDPIKWLKSWIGEIMLNTDNEPIEPSEIIRRIDEGGLKRFIEDKEYGR